MSITDELREWSHGFNGPWKRNEEMLTAIADRIDAEHEAALLNVHIDLMDASGWVRLPKDADGEYIHVGDVMEERSGHTFEVASLMAFGGSDNWLVLSDPRNFSSFREPHDIRHYHVPTVEDILREFALTVCKDDALTIRKDVVDEYAKRLTLAEVED